MRVIVLFLLVTLWGSLTPVAAAPLSETPPDWEVGNGHFYTQGVGGRTDVGFSVVDWGEVQFWTDFQTLGGVGVLGYPISKQFVLDDRPTQVFQYGALQWNPQTRRAAVLPALDYLSAHGRDAWLSEQYGVPASLPADFDAGKTAEQVATTRLALLDADAAIRDRYLAASRPDALFGLPASPVTNVGAGMFARFQKAVVQHWLTDTPDGGAGSVTLLKVGYVLKASGLVGADDVYQPDLAPTAPTWPSAPAAPPPSQPATPAAPAAPHPGSPPSTDSIPAGERWIDVNLSTQTTTAMVGDQPVHTALVTTGKPGYETPTGTFRIFSRVYNETMDSSSLGVPVNSAEGYRLTNVYFTQYFLAGGFALHYNYWQPREVFGHRPTSHGCVGMRYDDAKFFWDFASIGTRVVVHN